MWTPQVLKSKGFSSDEPKSIADISKVTPNKADFSIEIQFKRYLPSFKKLFDDSNSFWDLNISTNSSSKMTFLCENATQHSELLSYLN